MQDMQYFEQLKDVMFRSGHLVMQNFRGDYKIFEKYGDSIVTTVDLENELFLKLELAKIVPDAGFIAEESRFDTQASDFMWVIDPLDGTKNFIKGIPHFCIMVALTYKNEPIVAAIYQPVTQEFYYAEKDKGLWLQGKHRISFSERSNIGHVAMIVCSENDAQNIKKNFEQNKIQISQRYFGSAGIDAIYLAVGNIDLIILRDVAWWDVAAGILLIQEAGGLAYKYQASDVKSGYGTLKAGNELFFTKFL